MVIAIAACVKEGYDFLELFLKKYDCSLLINFNDDIARRYSGSIDFTEIADNNNIDILRIDSINSSSSVNYIKQKQIDLLIVVGWSEILKKEIISAPKLGVIGFHSSILPKYRGSAPVNWAIINGEEYSGNTMFWIDEGLDTGEIIDQIQIPISLDDNVKTVYEKVSKTGFELFDKNLDKIKKRKLVTINVSEKYPLNLKREPMDGLINWDWSSMQIYNFVRALTRPYPGAFTFTKYGKLFFWAAKIIKSSTQNSPGIITEISPNCIHVSTIDGAIEFTDFSFENDIYNKIELEKLFNKNHKVSAAKKIVCFAAHYDDEVLGIGGTLIKHFMQGDEVYIVFVCESYSVRYKEDMSILEDVGKAAYYLGAKEVIHLKFPDQLLDNIGLLKITQSFEDILLRINPDVVYTHFINDINKDHEIISRATMTACRPYSKTRVSKLFMYETPSSTEWNFSPEVNKGFKPNFFNDISSQIDRKIRAMKCYKSEYVLDKDSLRHPRNLKMLRQRAVYWGSVSNQLYSEPLILIRDIQ